MSCHSSPSAGASAPHATCRSAPFPQFTRQSSLQLSLQDWRGRTGVGLYSLVQLGRRGVRCGPVRAVWPRGETKLLAFLRGRTGVGLYSLVQLGRRGVRCGPVRAVWPRGETKLLAFLRSLPVNPRAGSLYSHTKYAVPVVGSACTSRRRVSAKTQEEARIVLFCSCSVYD